MRLELGLPQVIPPEVQLPDLCPYKGRDALALPSAGREAAAGYTIPRSSSASVQVSEVRADLSRLSQGGEQTADLAACERASGLAGPTGAQPWSGFSGARSLGPLRLQEQGP